MFCYSCELYPYGSSFRGFTPLEVVELLRNDSFKIIPQTIAYKVWYIKIFFCILFLIQFEDCLAEMYK